MLIVQVEDERSFQQMVAKEFKAQQFEVIHFDNAITALNYLEQVEPDILLADFKLGGPNGLKLATRVRELYPACAIVLISAYASKQDVREAFRNGIDDFLFKPIEMSELISDIFDAFRRRRSIHSRTSPTPDILTQDCVLNEEKRTLLWKNTSIKLTGIEFTLLSKLVSHPDRLFSPPELYAIATGTQAEPDKAQHVIGVHITNLRQKIKSTSSDEDVIPIQNVRGKGYKWVTQDNPDEAE